jgi:phage shock protein A
MGLFHRIGDIISANLNEMIDGFEDPEKMLKQAVREMEETIQTCKKDLLNILAHEKRLANELAGHRQNAARWQERAIQSVEAGDDDLARTALVRKKEHEKLTCALQDQAAGVREASGVLRRQLDAMRAKQAEAQRRLAGLVARKKAADFQAKLAVSSNQIELDQTAFAKFDRLREKVEDAEAEVEALQQLSKPYDSNDTRIGRTRDRHIVAHDVDVHDELARLKKELLIKPR